MGIESEIRQKICREYNTHRNKENGMQGLIGLGAGILSCASAVGKKEREGPLGECFDLSDDQDRFGQKTWEKAESEMQKRSFACAMEKAGMKTDGVDILMAGDLLNQCVGSAYGLLSYDIPYIGLYGACSTAAEGLLLGAAMIGHGICKTAGVVTSSHYCAAERQYRLPVEYGGQRPPTAQWTVTGSGAYLLGAPAAKGAVLTRGMAGIVVEKGIKDANNMGAAMAPAAASTLLRFFGESGETPENYDLIVTGDLGYEGSAILRDLTATEGLILPEHLCNDCGMMIYARTLDDTHAGGSGCGCSAVVLASYLIPKVVSGQIRRMLFVGTGAMMSPDSVKQGQTIPAVAHLVEIVHGK